MIRQPAVAGQFYSSNPTKLRNEIQRFIKTDTNRETAIGIIAPHAGYLYSGAVAGSVYSSVEIPDTVLILGPNHHGFGSRTALYPSGEWLTPLGSSKINDRLARLVKENSALVEDDIVAHHYEHSLEVQLPFLQYLNSEVTIVPLCVGFREFAACRELGIGIAKAIKEYGNYVLIVASSDMTHYESATAARKKDDLALGEVLALNAEGLLRTCRNETITMCGVIPAAIMIIAARELGATRARLVQYSTSGDVTGDNEQVVAYAAVTVL
ncbi:MAG TPA: AmmeMemoRadiSam system protein B [Syntrophales bacterium]|jgi:AmmeMemoRadiSam system protein B|nr:AmmeMemoRadiSam system protein B [Geobacteraceae bacterium]HLA04604.1 AmmeMemoRadiSam system protein B [Syntrophales bacterium]